MAVYLAVDLYPTDVLISSAFTTNLPPSSTPGILLRSLRQSSVALQMASRSTPEAADIRVSSIFSNTPTHDTKQALGSDAAFALGGEDGHLTVSLENLRHLSLNGTTATIGGGNHLGDVALYLWDNGEH